MKNTILFCSCLFILPSLSAQKVLSLENGHRFKRIYFEPGDAIRFQTYDSNAKFDATVAAVDDSMLTIVKVIKMENEEDATNNVFRDYVPLSEIKYVYNPVRNYWWYFRHMYYGGAMTGGGMLITMGWLNTMAYDRPPDPSSLIIATGILTSGLIVRYMGRDKYKIGNRWQLRAMEPVILPLETK